MSSLHSLHAAAVGRIEPQAQRFYHVVNHVLNREERWGQVCPPLGADPRLALRADCSAADVRMRVYRFELTGDACRRHILGLHDAYLEPAYRAALESAITNGRLALIRWSDGREAAAAGETGVLVVLRRETDRWRVATAYRPRPTRHDGSPGDPRSFFNATVRKWRDKTSIPTGAK